MNAKFDIPQKYLLLVRRQADTNTISRQLLIPLRKAFSTGISMTDSGSFIKVPTPEEEERMRRAAEESQQKREEARKKREMEEAMKKAGENSQQRRGAGCGGAAAA